jgi:hypothetical protein
MQDIAATKSKTWQAAQSSSDMAGGIFIGYQMQEDSNTAYQRILRYKNITSRLLVNATHGKLVNCVRSES